jgi:hypothetical protein
VNLEEFQLQWNSLTGLVPISFGGFAKSEGLSSCSLISFNLFPSESIGNMSLYFWLYLNNNSAFWFYSFIFRETQTKVE